MLTSCVELCFKGLRVSATIFLCVLLVGCGSGTIVVTPPSSTSSGTLGFANPVTVGSGVGMPGSVVVADFNGDGKPDIAVSTAFTNTLAIFLNAGNGVFDPPIVKTLNIANGTGSMVVGDFNEDGKLDLIIGTVAGPQATIVLLGKGDGTFTQQAPIANSFGFIAAQAVDLNGDGHLDLIEGGNVFLTVSLGNGDGTFGPATELPLNLVTSPIEQVFVKDFNGDGKLDVLAFQPANLEFGFFQSGNLLFFAGNGNGTFQNGTTTALGFTEPSSIAVGDFNSDGKLDLAIGSLGTVSIALGNGDGTFQLSSTVIVVEHVNGSSSNDFLSFGVADFDLDGKPDLVVSDSFDGSLGILLNGALGVTAQSTGKTFSFALSSGTSLVGVGDFNGDGIPDVVVTNEQMSQVSIVLSQK